jgi:ABC-2 type transport system permease protein
MVSSLYVYFRDLEHLLSIFVMTWMYLSPVIYTPDFVKGPLYHFFKLNPMFTVINAYRDILLYDRCPNLVGLGYSVVLGVALVLAGYMVYENLQRRFAEAL